jgi:hypothetical protein
VGKERVPVESRDSWPVHLIPPTRISAESIRGSDSAQQTGFAPGSAQFLLKESCATLSEDCRRIIALSWLSNTEAAAVWCPDGQRYSFPGGFICGSEPICFSRQQA